MLPVRTPEDALTEGVLALQVHGHLAASECAAGDNPAAPSERCLTVAPQRGVADVVHDDVCASPAGHLENMVGEARCCAVEDVVEPSPRNCVRFSSTREVTMTFAPRCRASAAVMLPGAEGTAWTIAQSRDVMPARMSWFIAVAAPSAMAHASTGPRPSGTG